MRPNGVLILVQCGCYNKLTLQAERQTVTLKQGFTAAHAPGLGPPTPIKAIWITVETITAQPLHDLDFDTLVNSGCNFIIYGRPIWLTPDGHTSSERSRTTTLTTCPTLQALFMKYTHIDRGLGQDKLLPEVVDDLARETPDKIYAEFPVSPTTYDSGYRSVTYFDLANAVNGAAQWLSKTLGVSHQNEVLAYIGPNDVRYTVFILAAVKVGYSLFLTSPRNSLAAHGRLFERLHCEKLLSPGREFPYVGAILDAHKELQHFVVPTVEQLLDSQHTRYPFCRSFDEARSEPLFIIHTSGSTGFPKPLTWTHETGRRHINMLAQDPPQGFKSLNHMVQRSRVFNCFPPFHGACLASYLLYGIPFGMVNIAPLSGAIVDAHGVAAALQKTRADSALLVPNIALEISQDDQMLDFVASKLQFCLYMGGDLPQEIGDKICSKLQIFCQHGMSEMGILPQLLPNSASEKDWKYIFIHPCVGTDFEKVADGNYELVVRRDPALEDFQLSFTLFPQLDGFRSRDLFQRHSSIPGFWNWKARADDIIVFINGEKTNPISMEQYVVNQNSDISAAIVVGTRRLQAALMVETTPSVSIETTKQEAEFVEKIWPSIDQANKSVPAHARIDKSMIILMRPDKPAVRAGKGTIQRAATLKLYSHEIDKLYMHADTYSIQDERVWDLGQVKDLVRNAYLRIRDLASVDDTENFFMNGIDSLQALTLARAIRKDLHIPDLTISTIYSNPSIASLSETISRLQKRRRESQENEAKAQAENVNSILVRYKERIQGTPARSMDEIRSSKFTVVLTGSTGTLGAYLLGSLLSIPNILHVYCLNRREYDVAAQKKSNAAIGLTYDIDPARVTFLKADYQKSSLGLNEVMYERIRRELNVIIHNAWPVDFNYAVDSFKPQFEGLLKLFSLSASADDLSNFFYVSSISSALNFPDGSNSIPEQPISDLAAAGLNGYAQSKFIAENLCCEASRLLNIPISVARVGQVAGPAHKQGIWNPTEWVPRLMMSSVNLGILPESVGSTFDTVNWIPVDVLAGAIVQLALDNQQPAPNSDKQFQVFHLLNPSLTTWQKLVPGILNTVKRLTGKQLKVVPSQDWVARVKEDFETFMNSKAYSAPSDTDGSLEDHLRRNPAAKILDFFITIMNDTKEVKMFDQTCTLAKSSQVRNMEAVKSPWLDKWIEGWLSTEFNR